MESKITEENAQRQIKLLKQQQELLQAQSKLLQDTLDNLEKQSEEGLEEYTKELREQCAKARKSHLTEADLNAALKLQSDYSFLQSDVGDLFLFVHEWDENGKMQTTLASENTYIKWIYDILLKAIKDGRFKPQPQE
jgi:histidinol dehydrogenase